MKNTWIDIKCSCCNGLKWMTEEPEECPTCGGSGTIYMETTSGILAEYPGGKFVGKMSKEEMKRRIYYVAVLRGDNK